MSVGIVTDSTCDLPAATLLRLGVAAVPLRIVVGEEVYRDWRDLDPLTLYGWMSEQGVLPRTSPPEVEDFLPVYRRFLNSYDEIVSIHLSGRLSDTVAHARRAAAELGAEDRIRVVDSRTAASALAEVVIAASERATTATDADRVVEAAEGVRDSIRILISPASLDWLVAGGRIGRARGLIGGLLGLRPILTMEGGELATEGTTRQKNVVDVMLRNVERRFGDRPIRVSVGVAGNDRSAVEHLKRSIETTRLNVVRGRVQVIGAAVGAHLGPGTIAMSAHPEPAA